MENLFCIKFNSGGYHSVYNNINRAKQALEKYSSYYPEMGYYLEEKKAVIFLNNFNKKIVKFEDSVGYLYIIEGTDE